MYWQDDYLDYTNSSPRPGAERLRLQAYVDGRLVDSWTEPILGSRWQRYADEFDDQLRPTVHRAPEPARHEQVLRWLDGTVGGREALLALTDEPSEPAPTPDLPDAESAAAWSAVQELLDRVAGALLDAEARRVPGQALARHLRGIDFHGQPRPRGCPDLASFACPELLTPTTRRTLIEWRDLALAAASRAVLPMEVE